jgi:hypothetical protein
MSWRRAPRAGPQGWVSEDGRWSVRGPIHGRPMFWLYRDNQRYTPTGRFDDAVSFPTAREAKAYAEAQA